MNGIEYLPPALSCGYKQLHSEVIELGNIGSMRDLIILRRYGGATTPNSGTCSLVQTQNSCLHMYVNAPDF